MTYRGPSRYFPPAMGLALFGCLPLAMGLALSGCLQDIPSPYVGSCTDYPETAYDYGDIAIGDCLAAPTDLKVYTGADGRHFLSVVNSNAYQIFSSGSLLNIDLDYLEDQLDVLREQAPPPFEGQEPVPVVLEIGDLRAAADTDPAHIGALALPTYAGQVAFGQAPAVASEDASQAAGPQPIAYVSNRLSITTNKYAPDYVYAADMADPLALEPFDLSDGAAPVGSDSLVVGKDPFGMAFADTAKGDYLYVVNESSHTLSVVRSSSYPIGPVLDPVVGLVTDPTFHDAGAPSFAAMGDLAVAERTYADDWTMSFVEGTYRAWYVGRGTYAGGAVGIADSGDALSYDTLESSPALLPGDANRTPRPWDADGIGPVSVLLNLENQKYLVFYEAQGTVANRAASRIGIATSSGDLVAGGLEKLDLNLSGNADDDYILDIGAADAFDGAGVGDPWVTVRSGLYQLWYTGTDASGRQSLGIAASTDAVNWKKTGALEFYRDAALQQRVSLSELGDGQGEATGDWSSTLGRFRLWFVDRQGSSTCLMYAESTDGLKYVLGGLDGGAAGCLEIGTDDPVVHSPSVIQDGHVLRLWYVSGMEDDPASDDWTLRYARGFDGLRWFPADGGGEPAGLVDGQSWEGGLPSPTILKLTAGNNLRLTGAQFGLSGYQIPVNQPTSLFNETLGFTVVSGQVLDVGNRGSTTSPDGGVAKQVGCESWDARSVQGPGYDEEAGQLYYTGEDSAGTLSIGLATRSSSGVYQWRNADVPGLTERASDCHPDTSAAPRSFADPVIVHAGSETLLYVTYGQRNGSRTFDSGEIRVLPRSGASSLWDPAQATTAIAPDEDEAVVGAPTVVPPSTSGGTWHMWFTSIASTGERRIAYASSSDGMTWTRPPRDETGAAVFALLPEPGGAWDDQAVEAPSVLRDEAGVYHMWYTGYNGATYRIGYATATPGEGETEADMTWVPYTVSGGSQPVLSGETGWWDSGGVTNPVVVRGADRYQMWYEGRLGATRRIGMAESLDGVHWVKVYDPLTVGDALTFRTRVVSDDGFYDEPSNVVDGSIPLQIKLNGTYYSGVGATEIALAPDQSIAVVGARFTAGVYVIDTRDDSSGEMFDANYNAIEAVIPVNQGTRSVKFSPSGDRFYATTVAPDSLLVFDRTRIEDEAGPRVIPSGVLLGSIPLENGLAEDTGIRNSADVGPIGLAITNDGRYLWVANANANNVFTVDLTLGVLGEVVRVARDVGELPVALALSPDERYLFVANYLGERLDEEDDRHVVHATIAVIDADRTSDTFGLVVARLKNLELEKEGPL